MTSGMVIIRLLGVVNNATSAPTAVLVDTFSAGLTNLAAPIAMPGVSSVTAYTNPAIHAAITTPGGRFADGEAFYEPVYDTQASPKQLVLSINGQSKFTRCRSSRATHASPPVRPRAPQCLRDLLRQPQPAQQMRDQRPQLARRTQLGHRLRGPSPGLGSKLRLLRQVDPVAARIAPQFPAQVARITAKHLSDGAKPQPLLSQRSQHHSLYGLHLWEFFRQPHTLPGRQGVAFQI